MNKTRSHLHMFKKIKLTHRCFKSSQSICTSWIDRVNFLHFWPSKICVSSTDIISSLLPPRCRLSSDRHRHAIVLCHIFFPLSQDELAASGSSFINSSPRCLSFWVKIETLNPHHRRRLPSSNLPTPTLQCYKKDHLNLGHFPHHSITSPSCLISSQSNTPSELHPPLLFPFTVVSYLSSLRTMTPTIMN
jgi:hypothetical protein